MNIPHIHIMLNHIPVIGIIFCGILLLTANILRNVQFQRVALSFLFIVALSAIPVFLTGEPTEEIVEDLPGVSEHYIKEHEEAALFAFIGMEVCGVLALLGLILFRRSPALPAYVTSGILILIIVGTILFAWTAYLGGHIRHSEIRPDFQSSAPSDD